MDREISKSYIRNKRKKIIIKISATIIILVLLLTAGYKLLKPNINLQHTPTCIANIGSVETSFNTSGLVEPYYQELLTAAISSDILEINYAPGDIVTPSDTVFIPDITELISVKKNINHEIAIKINRINRSKEELRRNRINLINNLKKDSINIEQLKSSVKKEEYLFSIGGGSQQKVDKSKIDYELAKIDRKDKLNDFESFKQLQKLDLESMELELELKDQERNKILNRINNAYVQPKIKGMITSLLVEPGQHVTEGQAMAHVSDAERFKVSGSVSTRYADKIYLGQSAIVNINDSIIDGHVTSISPSVDNGSINYTINLSNPTSQLLRPKLQVEVRLVLSLVPSSVRIQNRDYYQGPGNYQLFVKNGDNLEKREVRLGGASFNYVEVISGVNDGELVVVSSSFNKEYQRYKSLGCTE
jgi:HlyD family secretion protein